MIIKIVLTNKLWLEIFKSNGEKEIFVTLYKSFKENCYTNGTQIKIEEFTNNGELDIQTYIKWAMEKGE